jgi:predicted NodU family carbamoyl transferase
LCLAPAVPEEDAADYFNLKTVSPYMLLVASVNDVICRHPLSEPASLMDRLYQVRSELPAITHMDYLVMGNYIFDKKLQSKELKTILDEKFNLTCYQ